MMRKILAFLMMSMLLASVSLFAENITRTIYSPDGNPSEYLREPECVDFITSVPTVFNEAVPIAGEIGEFVTIARRSGNPWYVGALTNWDEREIKIDFSFLEAGRYEATVFCRWH